MAFRVSDGGIERAGCESDGRCCVAQICPDRHFQDIGMAGSASKRYRITKWKGYNQALIQRGALSIGCKHVMASDPDGKVLPDADL